jgi:hypothetical protein
VIFCRLFVAALIGLVAGGSAQVPTSVAPAVHVQRVPNGGIQPEVVRDRGGALHMLYFSGEPAAGDLFYVRSSDDGKTFSRPVRVNSQQGSAIATGTIRGGQLALGRGGRVHVAWNGSGMALPRGPVDVRSGKPGSAMLYTRSNGTGTTFEPQRTVMQRSVVLDGGGGIAADSAGNVWVAWHANDAATGNNGEENRRLFVAHSLDDGRQFAPERAPWREPTGACSCCGVRMLATRGGGLLLLFRAATANVNRDMFLLRSADEAQTFTGSRVHAWEIAACPMTSMSLVEGASRVLASWETDGQVYFGMVDAQRPAVSSIRAPSGDPRPRKHPRLAIGPGNRLLMAWTERTSWARGGAVAWQLFDEKGEPLGPDARESGLPVWSYAAAVPRADGGFTIFY